MPNVRSDTANAYETTLTSPVTGTDLTFSVQSTSGAPGSPCYLCVDPDDPEKREYIWFDGAFSGTTFATTSLQNRHLNGSAATSGLTHEPGARVRAVTAAQLFQDIWDGIEDRVRTSQHTKSLHDLLGISHPSLSDLESDDHPQYARTDGTRDGMPSGSIIGWDPNRPIPAGWALCDGTNGTPNLVNRFLVAAGDQYEPGDTGGSDNAIVVQHNHGRGSLTAASHNHGNGTLTAASHNHGNGSLSAASHNHNISARTSGTGGSGGHSHPDTSRLSHASGATPTQSTIFTTGSSGGLNVSGSTSNSGSLNVSGSTANSGTLAISGSTANAGSSGTGANRPRYFALYFIMKL